MATDGSGVVPNSDSNLKQRYSNLAADREQFLIRARRCSELTIPTLIPPNGHGPHTVYNTPWQGVGARGVNNLASKLLLSLLPPNSPFFRLKVDDFTLEQLTQQKGMRGTVEEGLGKIERAVMDELEGGFRAPMFEALKHLIVGGNCLVLLPDTGVRVFRLDQYVVKRDPDGNVLDVIVEEKVAKSSLPDDIHALIEQETLKVEKAEEKEEVIGKDDQDDLETVCIYTRMYRDGTKFKGYQEVEGIRVPGSEGSWPVEKPPAIVLRWVRVDGEDYGRGYVEEYIGDLISLEGLSKAIVQSSAASSKIVFLVNPNGVTNVKQLSQAESGDFVVGKKDDITTVQVEKYPDMRITFETIKEINERLGYAFLLNTAIQRNAERVTAEEIRYMAGELEDALGGVYSILSQEFQLPLVNRVMDRMTRQKRLPALPKGIVKPVIVTGLEALGRGHDLNKYNQMLSVLQPLGPEVIAQKLNVDEYIKRVGTSLGIDMDGLVKTPEQVAAEAQQAAQQAAQANMMDIAKAAAPNAVKAVAEANKPTTAAPSGPPQGNKPA